MSINLMEMVKGAIGDQVVKQMGGILGESEDKTSSALNSAIPAILGGLMKKASTPSGAGDLFSSLDDHDGGILDNLGDVLSGGGQTSMLESGGGILKMLFGASQSGIVGTLAKLAGIGTGSAGSLLSMLAPIIMGILGRQRKKQGWDLSSFTDVLMSQKSHLASSLPSELSDQLGVANMLGGAQQAVNQATTTAGNAMRDAGKGGGGLAKLLLPLILVGGLGFLAYNFFLKGGVEVPELSDAGPELSIPNVSLPDIPELSIPGLPDGMADLPGKLSTTFDGLTSAVSGITDEASATSAVSSIQDAAGQLSGFGLDQLPSAAKSSVSTAISPLIETLKAAVEKAYAIPGVRGILEPALAPIMSIVDGLAG